LDFIVCTTGLAVLSGFLFAEISITVLKTRNPMPRIFANVVKEGHGGMTAFLWVSFGAILAWQSITIIVNWSQFYVITAIGSTIG
jgi:hypothetical protein